jgi:pimeloyl-ACP methyl ester carboxylesterase
MLVDLVSTKTSDGLKLHGALHAARDGAKPIADGPDVLVCLPGVGGNFYGTTMAEHLTPWLTAAGIDVLWINTRGHDSIAVIHRESGGGVRQGAAFEIVDDCRHDIAGWLDFVAERGYRSPTLLGHSLGAIKSLYSQAYAPRSEVHSVVAVSPPRLSCRAFRAGPDSGPFFEDLSTAQQHVEAGRARQLMQTRFPVPLIISAGTFVDKYGPEERYNILKFTSRLECPHVFIYGGRELEQGGIAFAGVPDELRGLPERRFQAPVLTVPDANHMYTGLHESLAREVLTWLGERRTES